MCKFYLVLGVFNINNKRVCVKYLRLALLGELAELFVQRHERLPHCDTRLGACDIDGSDKYSVFKELLDE